MFLSFTHTYNMERSNSFRISLKKKKRKNGEKREEEATRFSPSIWSALQVFQREGKSFWLNFQFYLTYCPYVILLEL
jgi:hypothetical protein